MHRTVIEVGPVAIRRLCCGAAESGDAGAAALEWVDDPVALLDDQPVGVPQLWCSVLEELICPVSAGSVLLIHPSWWPVHRIERIRAAVGRADVTVRSRAELLARPGVVLIEIAVGLVAVVAGETSAEPRLAPPGVVAAAVAGRVPSGASVVIDAPAGVPGAAELARLITGRLRAAGARVAPVQVRVPGPEAPETRQAPAARQTPAARQAPERLRNPPAAPRRIAPHLAVAAALTLLAVGVLGAPRARDPEPSTVLVEGRVALQVPADWPARRVTDGPGSARVEVVSPVDPQLMLHLTQVPIPDPSLAAVAEALDRAVRQANAQGPVFVDFNPTGTAAGRPAITYRELRPGHRIDWTVLVDGGIRIGIGCQRPDDAGTPDAGLLGELCEQAVRSARALSAPPR